MLKVAEQRPGTGGMYGGDLDLVSRRENVQVGAYLCLFLPIGSVSAGREKCPFNVTFLTSRRLVWPNQAILMTSFDFRSLIMTCGCLSG